MRFSKINKYRTKPIAGKIDLKRKRPSAEKRSESPEAKRQRPSLMISLGSLLKVSSTNEGAPSLPSPTASQPPAALPTSQPAPVRSATPKPQTPRVASPKPRKKSPAISKKKSPAVPHASPAVSRASPVVSRASPAVSRPSPAVSRASPARPLPRTKRVVLKFNKKRAEFAILVGSSSESVNESTATSQANAVQPVSPTLASITNGVALVKPEIVPQPALSAIPTSEVPPAAVADPPAPSLQTHTNREAE